MKLLEFLQSFFLHLWDVSTEAAPWLLIGLIFAGLIKVFIPPNWMARWLGKKGPGSVIRAALIGIPLPLCSCGVLPAAIGVRKHGASKGATISFLVATPQNGVDSIMLSYALLGPFMAIARPIASLISALTAGLLSDVVDQKTSTDETNSNEIADAETKTSSCCASKQSESKPEPKPETKTESCCSSKKQTTQPPKPKTSSCCDSKNDASESTEINNNPTPPTPPTSTTNRITQGLKFAITDILDDIIKWLAVGLLLAALINTFITPDQIEGFGSGLPAMLLMVLIGVPMYICASASTPLGASLLIAGISPGTVLVFLLAGPATNIAGLAVVKKELGMRVLIAYLTGIIGGALICGLATDALMAHWQIQITKQMTHAQFIPPSIEVASTVFLLICAIKPIRKHLINS